MQETNDRLDYLDVRSLRLLQALLETRSVTKAGEVLVISQPAASRLLARLRRALQDPLVVRGRHGSVLTPRAESLRPKLTVILDALPELIQSEIFDPAKVMRSVRIATTDHGSVVVLAKLAKAIAHVAPGITWEITPWSAQTLAELETSSLDLALDAFSVLLENFHFKALYEESYACLVRNGHPLLRTLRADGKIDPDKAAAFPHVLFLYPVGDRFMGDNVLERLGFPPKRIVMRTPYFATAPSLLSGTDNLMLTPTRLGQVLARQAPVTLIPLHARTDFRYRLIWHERTQKDRCMEWVRSQIYKVAG